MTSSIENDSLSLDMPPARPGVRIDAPFLWPVIVALAAPLLLVGLWTMSFDAAFLGVPFVLGGWGLAASIAMVMAIVSISQRRWWRAGSLLVLPALAAIAIAKSGAFWLFAMDTGEHLHFRIMRGAYLAYVATLPTDHGPRLAIFDWGGFGVSHAVVYDESDEIVKPAVERSTDWKSKIANTELSCGVAAEPQGDHFYIVGVGC